MSESNQGDPTAASFQPPRQRVLGIVLLILYLGSFALVAFGVYRVVYVVSMIAESEPLDGDALAREEMIRSTRYALQHGPLIQRIEILRNLGSEDLPATPFIDDLRRLVVDPHPIVALEAGRAVRRLTSAGSQP